MSEQLRNLPIPALRLASDDDRERVSGALVDHYADGRLSQSEFERRSEIAINARTRAELALVLNDLPATASTPRGPGIGRIFLEGMGGVVVGLMGLALVLISLIVLIFGGTHWWVVSLVGLVMTLLGVGGLWLARRHTAQRRPF